MTAPNVTRVGDRIVIDCDHGGAINLAEQLDQSTDDARALADRIDLAVYPDVAYVAAVAVKVIRAELEEQK